MDSKHECFHDHSHHIDAAALAEITKLVQRMQKIESSLKPNESLELEARIQSANGGLTHSKMEEILAKLVNANPSVFEKVTTWEESRDIFFYIPQSVHMMRGELRLNSSSLESQVRTVHKVRIESIDLRTSKYNVRLTLSKESVVPEHLVPDVTRPEFIRVKQRRSFVRCSTDECARFSYDVTQSWSGESMQGVEEWQSDKSRPPAYEFEIELAYSHPDLRPNWIATSLLLKSQDHLEGEYLTVHQRKRGRAN